MKGSGFTMRSSRLGMAFIMLMSLHTRPVQAAPASSNDAGLIPIKTSNLNYSLIDELFAPRSGGFNQGNNQGNNQGTLSPRTNPTKVSGVKMTSSNINGDFKCNLFETVPFNDILSAVNALNAAVSSPACGGGDPKGNAQSVVNSSYQVTQALKDLQGYYNDPSKIKDENASVIVDKVDIAVRAATSLANVFAQSDVLKKECREGMNKGQIAVAIGDLVNGLTPYALMAATLTTGGTAAVPFLVGGSLLTGTVTNMAKIITEDGVNIKNGDVRRAIVENTCQYIRIDQRYKFLIKSRAEQISAITKDLGNAKYRYSGKVEDIPKNVSALAQRKNALDQISQELNVVMGQARSQLDLDKLFMKGTTDNIKICQLGIQMANMSKDKSTYVAQLLASLDKAMIAYGTTSIAQAQALKTSGALAMNRLEEVNRDQFTAQVNYASCAEASKSFVETIDQSASLARQLVKLASESVEKSLLENREYSRYKARLSNLTDKEYQAVRVEKSLDKLREYANKITQSEIDAEMRKVRGALFKNNYMGMSSSPVLKWFEYVNELHNSEVARFKAGIASLQRRAFNMTSSGKLINNSYGDAYSLLLYQKQIDKDRQEANNLYNFNLKKLPLGTTEHEDVCRELQDVWSHWTVAMDHMAASDSFCNMIEPYIYDNRPEDAGLVKMCRGYSKNATNLGARDKAVLSTLANNKATLVKNLTHGWALVIKKRMAQLACVDRNSNAGF